jgi:NADH-quinone oxidoreductase subunit M
MFDARFVLSAAAVLSPLGAALLILKGAAPRTISLAASVISLLCCVGAALLAQSPVPWFAFDDLSTVPAVLIAGLSAAILIAAPRRDINSSACTRLLIGLSGVLMIYASASVPLMFAGWILSAAPFVKIGESREGTRWFARPAVALGVSVLLVGIAAVLLTLSSEDFAASAFTLAVIGSLIRSGIFPFHSWAVASFESDAMLSYVWLLNARTGVMLLAKLTLLAPAELTTSFMPLINDLALFSSVLMAVMAIGEKVHRRVLGLVVVSQSGFIISGMQTANVEGVSGALVQWIVVSMSAIGLAVLIRGLEERYGSYLQQRFAGLGAKVPRMAVLFLLFALALVGFPGTLGFSAEDLLFHGALEAHPILGIALPVATTLIAIRLLALFSSIFLGRRGASVPAVSDALPRERWVLTAFVALLVIAGLAPQTIIDSRIQSARRIASHTAVGETAARR